MFTAHGEDTLLSNNIFSRIISKNKCVSKTNANCNTHGYQDWLDPEPTGTLKNWTMNRKSFGNNYDGFKDFKGISIPLPKDV